MSGRSDQAETPHTQDYGGNVPPVWEPLAPFASNQDLRVMLQNKSPQYRSQGGLNETHSIATQVRPANTHLANRYEAICAISRKLPRARVTLRMPFDARSI